LGTNALQSANLEALLASAALTPKIPLRQLSALHPEPKVETAAEVVGVTVVVLRV
jgi:hypothetical protein